MEYSAVYYEEIERRLRLALANVSDSIPELEKSHISSFLEHGEYGEALISMAWALVEKNIPISADLFLELRDISTTMSLDEFPEDLASQVVPSE